MIKFMTNQLYIATKDKASQLYHSYIDSLKCKNMVSNKSVFRDTLKHNFREQVASGHHDEADLSPKSNKEELI